MIFWLDRIARIGMGLGIACIFQPWWNHGLRVGFLLTLVFTILHIVTSHRILPKKNEEQIQ